MVGVVQPLMVQTFLESQINMSQNRCTHLAGGMNSILYIRRGLFP